MKKIASHGGRGKGHTTKAVAAAAYDPEPIQVADL